MKRIMVAAAAVTAITLGYLGSRLWAQAGGPGMPAPEVTRVAFVNVAKVFQQYERATFYKKEMETLIEPKRLLREKLAKEIVSWKTWMNDPKFDPTQKERYERGIVKNQRELEDLDRDIRQMLGQRNEQQYLTLYKDMNDAVERYARANNLQVVLAYVEPMQGDPFSIMNLMRKMEGMNMCALIGLVQAPGLDISSPVVDLLNQNYRAGGGTVLPSTAPNAPPGSFPSSPPPNTAGKSN